MTARTLSDPSRSPARRSGGRPTRAAALALDDHLIDIATATFLKDGYEATSLERIAAEARIGKRTLYARFAGKAALFEAAVRRFASTRIARLEERDENSSLERQLTRIGLRLLAVALQPDILALDRVITAEATRFPELAQMVYGQGVSPALEVVASLLDRAQTRGEIGVLDTRFAAEQFLFCVAGIPHRRATVGLDPPGLSSRQRRRLRAAVQLFIRGCRGADDLPTHRRQPPT